MPEQILTREDLIERVTLPLGNISHTLAALLDNQLEVNPVTLKAGLRSVQANAEEIHRFLLGLTLTTEQRREPRTPEQLRRFVAEQIAHPPSGTVSLPIKQLSDVH